MNPVQELQRFISKVTSDQTQRIKNMIARGVITAIKDSIPVQELQATLLYEEVADQVERLQQYGFNSVPPAGIEALFLFHGGDRSHPVCIGFFDRDRPTDWQSEDSGLYANGGKYIRLMADAAGNIHLFVPVGQGGIRLEADDIDIHARNNLRYDAGGTGYHVAPALIKSYTQGVAGTSHAPTPPEIP